MEAKLSSSDQLANQERSDYLGWLPEKDGDGYLRRMSSCGSVSGRSNKQQRSEGEVLISSPCAVSQVNGYIPNKV
jgi:predicted chitinase